MAGPPLGVNYSGSGYKSTLRLSCEKLGDAVAPIEDGFLKAGEQLGNAVESLHNITSSCRDLSSRMAENELAASTERLEHALLEVAHLANAVGAGHQSLAELTGLAGTIGDRINRLSRTIGEVEILGINAKVEAAHVTSRNVDFSVFTREIGRLAELAGDSLTKLSRELFALGRLINDARASQESFEKENQKSLAAIARRLEDNLRKVKGRQETAVAASIGIGKWSREIAANVAQAVRDLQIGDITRQQVEHVQHGLEVIGRLLTSSDEQTGADKADERPELLMAAVCRLEAAQLKKARDDLARESDQIVSTLSALAGEADDIRLKGAEVCGSGAVDGASFLSELSRDLDQARTLLEKYAQARSAIEDVTRSVSAGVSEMVKYLAAVHSIEADMRVMGLNATLKCGRLGNEGRALSVIAQELRGFANRTAEDGKVIMSGLEQLIGRANSLAGSDQVSEAAEIGELIGDMTVSVRALETAGNDLAVPLASLERESERIGSILNQAIAQVTGCLACGEILRQVLSMLDALVASVPQTPSDDIQMVKERVLRMMKGRYTMASEREIHTLFDQIDGGNAAPATKAGSSPSETAGDIDDLLF